MLSCVTYGKYVNISPSYPVPTNLVPCHRVTAGAGRLSEIERLYGSTGGGDGGHPVDGSEDSDCDESPDHHQRGSSVGTRGSEMGGAGHNGHAQGHGHGQGQGGRGVSGGGASVTFSEGGGGFGGGRGGHSGENKSDSVRAPRVFRVSAPGVDLVCCRPFVGCPVPLGCLLGAKKGWGGLSVALETRSCLPALLQSCDCASKGVYVISWSQSRYVGDRKRAQNRPCPPEPPVFRQTSRVLGSMTTS